ncbi:MAG: hypothetical protein JXA33_00760 [Anaerolineae bacterium]|nr:hypothetical protein [Anaerolineae bacterium]
MIGNPLRYIDPTGYFSEEQLNWLGLFREGFTQEQWSFLLAAEYGDIVMSDNSAGFGLGINHTRSSGGNASFELVFNDGINNIQASDWFADYRSSYTIHRDTPDGWQVVYHNGEFGEWYHALGQSGWVVTTPAAAWEVFFHALLGDLAEEGYVPIICNLLNVELPGVGIIRDFISAMKGEPLAAGELAGDIQMLFYYSDPQGNGVWIREFWFRPSHDEGFVIDNSWTHFPISPFGLYEEPEYSWNDDYYSR